jgi:hypothetical protein
MFLQSQRAGHAGIASCTESTSARKTKRRAGSNLISLLLDIEQPLRDVTHTVEALRLVGHGLFIHDNAGGDAVAELARIAAQRLQVVEDTWNKVLEARRREKS